MSKKKLAEIIGVCSIAIMIIVVITILPSCESSPTVPTLVTHDCTGQKTSSLRGQGEVKDIGAGLLSRRGFVWLEGDSGNPELNTTAIPVVNPSFEEGAPPTNWTASQAVLSRETTIVKVGAASIKISSNGTWACAYQAIPNHADYAGKRVTVGVWYYAPSTNNVEQRILICDGVGCGYSGFLSTDDAWHWITVSRTIGASPTTLKIQLLSNHSGTSDSDDVLYVDGVILFVGDAVFEDGEFGAGIYSLTIKGLEPNTSYRVRAFGQNEAGIGYGNTVTCKTLAA